MKLFLIGGHGTIGKHVAAHYQAKNEVIIGGRTKGDVLIDIADSASIAKALEEVGEVDGICCVAGEAKWNHFDQLTEEDYYVGIRSKLMGQVNLVRLGQKYVRPGGSITLSTGILADDPVPQTTSAAMVNGAIHSFVQAVNLELDQLRVNVVALGLVEDAFEKYEAYFPGHYPVSMRRSVFAYVRSIEGKGRGEIIRVYE